MPGQQKLSKLANNTQCVKQVKDTEETNTEPDRCLDGLAFYTAEMKLTGARHILELYNRNPAKQVLNDVGSLKFIPLLFVKKNLYKMSSPTFTALNVFD